MLAAQSRESQVLSELSFSCSVTCIKVHVPSRTQQRAGTIRVRPVGTHARGWCLLASVHSLRACVLGGQLSLPDWPDVL